MGALPKNKITSVERGKRRAGNRPKLVKDVNAKAPLHKQGFMAEFLNFLGLGPTTAPAKAAAKTATKASSTAATKSTSQAPQVAKSARPVKAGSKAGGKTIRKAQHKG